MIKDQRHASDQHPAVSPLQRILPDIPGRQVRARVPQDDDAGKLPGPAVEVLLVGEASLLDTVVAPLQTALAPPLQTRLARRITAKRQVADIVDAVGFPLSGPGRVAMPDDQNGAVPELGFDWARIGEEIQVRVEIGDDVDLGMLGQEV